LLQRLPKGETNLREEIEVITTIYSPEAKAGCTTIAINLASILADAGHKVLLIDACRNRDATRISLKRTEARAPEGGYLCHNATASSLNLAIERLYGSFKHVIIDTDKETALTAACRSDHYISVRLRDRGITDCIYDKILAGRIDDAVITDDQKPDIRLVFNRQEPNSPFEHAANKSPGSIFLLPNRSAFSRCADGLAVIEVREELDLIAMNALDELVQILYGPTNTKAQRLNARP
jgi:hypothetical protein